MIVGSGAGGGTVAQRLAPLCERGLKVAVLEKGPKLRDEEFTGRELEMAGALYQDSGGVLTADRTMTLAMGVGYGGSTTVYTGTSLTPPARVIGAWGVPGLDHADVEARARRFMDENSVHLLDEASLNQNNLLFRQGCQALGYEAKQFPVNLKGCKGSSLCNLGCPNAAKQGTNRVQLPNAERGGVEVVTRCEVLQLDERALVARVTACEPGGKGEPSTWEVGDYRLEADRIVCCAGSVHTVALLLRSRLGAGLPRLGRGFTAHPALILAAEHEAPITNAVGHPKSFYLDQFAEDDGYLLETCMYFPFTTAKSLSGFGLAHSEFVRAFPRLQQILCLALDKRHPPNRITIDGEGQPVVHYAFTPRVSEALARGTRAAARIFFAAGALRVHAPLARPHVIEREDRGQLDARVAVEHFLPGRTPISAAHMQGGCAMGERPQDSVTDARGRVHGLPWLYVADSALFPDSVEVNPYLTVMALADRVAEAVAEDLGSAV